MANKTTTNPFQMFGANTIKTAKIKALGDAEIKYRELTMAESDAFSKRLIKNMDEGINGGTPQIDFNEASKIKYEKVALILVEPKMTIDELKALPVSAADAINEILSLAEPEMGKDEGN